MNHCWTHLEFLRIEHLLLDLFDPRFFDGRPSNGPQTVLHAISESTDLIHVELVLFDAAFARLVLLDPPPHLFIMSGRRQGDISVLLFAPFCFGHGKGQGHTSATSSSRSSDSVRVGGCGSGQIEVEHTGDVDKVNAARYAIFDGAVCLFGCFAFSLEGFAGLTGFCGGGSC